MHVRLSWSLRRRIHSRRIDSHSRVIRLRVDSRGTGDHAQAAFGVEQFLLSLSRSGLAVPSGSLTRMLSAKMLAATEWAEQISTMGVTGMREEANSTMATKAIAIRQMGMRHQHRVEGLLILSNKRIGRRSLVPVGKKRERFSDS